MLDIMCQHACVVFLYPRASKIFSTILCVCDGRVGIFFLVCTWNDGSQNSNSFRLSAGHSICGRTVYTAASTHVIEKVGGWNMIVHEYIYVNIYKCVMFMFIDVYYMYIYIYPLDIFNQPMVGWLAV